MRDKILLRQLQALPLNAKVLMTQQRIREWYNYWHGDVVISFSGGKDSTVLAHLVHDLYPDVPMVFSNTGLEYPEIQEFARRMGAEFVRPKMRFDEVISKYGYPIIGKEVAEAIHYARRIVPASDVKLETERRRKDVQGRRSDEIPHYERSRTELHGKRDDTKRIAARKRKMENGELQHTTGKQFPTRDRLNLLGKRGFGSVRPDKTIEDVDTRTEIADESNDSGSSSLFNSQFNKKKWLPLSQETTFRISHYCCNVMKKSPMGIYQRRTGLKPFIGTLAEESRMRTQAWVRHGCNSFEGHKQTSQPMSFWTEQDVLHYIKQEGLEICSVYGDILATDDTGMMYEPIPCVECNLKCTGCQRTGCVFCGFGVHLEKGETRFQRLAKTHPKQYEYCMNGGQWVDNPAYDPTAQKMDGDWQNWNPKKIWVPSKEGLGFRKVFDDCNQIYGKDFIRYE